MEETQLMKVTSEASHSQEYSSVKQLLTPWWYFHVPNKTGGIIKRNAVLRFIVFPVPVLIPNMPVTVNLTLDLSQKQIIRKTNHVGTLNAKIKSIANRCKAAFKKDCRKKPRDFPHTFIISAENEEELKRRLFAFKKNYILA